MHSQEIAFLFSEWNKEFNETLTKSNSLCIALFNIDGELLFANDTITLLFKGESVKSFINPTFNQLLELDNTTSLIFNGFLTIGDYFSISTSIWAQVYRKDNKILILGGVNRANASKKILHLNI